jgi:extracellular elastinolytic metalloproteinase
LEDHLVKPRLFRRSSAKSFRYRPHLDLLEDRNAPGSMLSLTSSFLFSAGAAVKTRSAPTTAANQPAALELSTTLSESGSTTAALAVIPEKPRATAKVEPTVVSQVFDRSEDPALAQLWAALTVSPSPTPGTASPAGTAHWLGGSSGELPKAASRNQGKPANSEMEPLGNVLIATVGPLAGEQGTVHFRTAGTGPGSLTNVYELGGPVAPGRPSTGIFISDGSFDVRTPYLTGQRFGLTDRQITALQTLQQRVPGLRVNVNTVFGRPSSLINANGFLTDRSPLPPRDVVLQFIYDNKDALGLTDADVRDLVTTDMYTNQVGKRITHVYLQQQYNGIPVFQGVANGSVMPNGRLIILGNHLVTDLAGSINTTTPAITQAQAIAAAAQSMGIRVTQPLQLVQDQGGPTQAQVYRSAEVSRQDIPVSLRFLPIQKGETRLVWHTVIESPLSRSEWYEVNVDAQTGQVWNRFNYYKGDSYRVLHYRFAGPHEGSFSIQVNPADPLANGFPFRSTVTWHNTDNDPEPETFTTTGNNVIAQEDRDGDDSPIGRRPAPNGNATGSNDYNYVWDPTREPYEPAVPFDPGPPPVPGRPAFTTNMFAAIVQAYYLTNIFHDVLYYYGFTEAAGNFQIVNFGRGGRGNDPVLVDVQDDADNGTFNNANFATPPDGTPGRAQFYIFDFTTPNRDSAMYSEIVFHELAHGLSTRLNGGPQEVTGLSGTQSGGMGEGWSDFVPLWFNTKPDQRAGDPVRYGRHILGQPPTGLGVRRVPYDTTQRVFGQPNTYDHPITYNDIDPLQEDVVWPYNPPLDPRQNGADNIYSIGELWCETLWDLNWALIKKYGYSSDLYRGMGGNNIAMRLVTEALRLTPINPTLLNGRDALLAADFALYGGANQREIWTAFAARGMGQFAHDGGDHNSVAVRENFTIPPIFGGGGGGGGGGGTGNGDYPGNGSRDSRYEPNDFSNQAFNLGRFKAGSKQIPGLQIRSSPTQDRDWFRFRTHANGATLVQIDMAANAGDLDLIVYRRTSNGTLQEVGRSATRARGGIEAVAFDAVAGEHYFFQVYGYNGATGNYGITISAP